MDRSSASTGVKRSSFFDHVALSRLRARQYKRDKDGRFASTTSGNDADEGEHGFGRDPNGVSYTEHDVDEHGQPRFSEAYRAKYGPVTNETVHESNSGPIAVVRTERGPYLHIADDARGTKQRQVIQELSRPEAAELADGVYAVYNGEKASVTTSSGVSVAPAGADPTRDGVVLTWGNGRKTHFAGEAGNDAAFELQESLQISSGATNRAGL